MHIRTLTLSLFAMLSMVLYWGSPAQATVFFDDDFEANTLVGEGFTTGSCTYLQPSNPNPADGCNPLRSTDIAHSGTHSLKGIYRGVDSGEWIDRGYPWTDNVYTRFWYRTTAFTYDPTGGTKNLNLGDQTHYPNFWVMHLFGSREFGVASQLEASGSNVNYTANTASVSINDNQWYCVETHIKMNTPGVADGVLEIWVDGTQTLNYPGRTFRSTTPDCSSCSSSNAAFNNVRIFVQHGVGSMYYDNFALGNTRIGCSGSPASDITPPAAPVGLAIR